MKKGIGCGPQIEQARRAGKIAFFRVPNEYISVWQIDGDR